MNNRLIAKTISTAINFILAVTLGILVPKAIGPQSYGEYNYIISTFGFIVQFLMLSTIPAYIYFLSNEKYKHDEINLFYSLYLTGVSLIILIVGVLIIELTAFDFIWNEINIKYLLYLGLIFSITINIHDVLIAFADSTKQTFNSEKIKLVSKSIVVFAIICFVFLESLNIYNFFVLMILNYLIFYILFYFKIEFTVNKNFNKTKLKSIFVDFYIYIKPLIIFSIVAALYSYYGKFVLQNSTGSVEQGYYNFAFQLALIPITFVSALMTIYMSEFTKLFKMNNIEYIKDIFTNSLLKIYTIHLIITLIIYFNVETIILLTVGEEFISAKYALEILVFYSLFQTIGLFSRNIYFSSNRVKEYSVINTIVMIFGLMFLTYIFITNISFDAYLLAIIMALFYFIRTFIQLIRNIYFLNISYTDFLKKFFFINILITSIIYLCSFIESIFLQLLVLSCILIFINFTFKDYYSINKLLRLKK